ncbi:metal ABC transporter permease [Saccharicrinis sp. FJH62]|uniref:metal ABC transporter permease n=1 Tax=Saccharicrinis sp. FJH62 TaxID=3344657 RepID=UPI0035D4DF89
MNDILNLFEYRFFTNAIWGSLLASILCGIIGTYIVSRKMVFVSGGLSHAAFGGIGLGYYLGFNPIFSGVAFAILAGLGIEHVSHRFKFRKDSVIAVAWSAGMAAGILLVSLKPGYSPDLMSYLLGNILTITSSELWLMAGLVIATTLFFVLYYNTILITSFDEDFARVKHIPVNLINSILIILTAATVVITIRVVGIILILALLSIPQETANLFTRNFKKIIIGSIIIGIIATLSGLVISYYFDLITGPVIISVLIIFYAVARLIKHLL